jgi:hypothetical protein
MDDIDPHKLDGEIVEFNLELEGDFVQSNDDRPQKVLHSLATNMFSDKVHALLSLF